MLKFVIAFLLFCGPLSAKQYDLAICAIFQNEARFMKEWIDYHRVVGVQHFYLYNNESNDNFEEVLQPYVDNGIVELFYWPTHGEKKDFAFSTQAPAYMDAIHRSKGKARWLAMIDLDEFMVPKEGSNLSKLLKKHFKDEVGVVIYWQMFGTSHVEMIQPNELMIEKLTLKAPYEHIINTMFKSIVRPECVHYCDNPHFAHYIQGEAVNTLKWPTHPKDEKAHYTTKYVQLNHYWTRDIHHIITVKWPRLQQYGNANFDSYLKGIEVMNSVEDHHIQKFIPKLKSLQEHDLY